MITKNDILNEYCQKIIPILIGVVIMFAIACVWVLGAGAEEVIDVQLLANAIYKAEGGAKTSHPYGIMTKYKTTTPRQACINTIKSALKRWNGEEDFIAFLGKTYCPPQTNPLNKFWAKNVRYFYERS